MISRTLVYTSYHSNYFIVSLSYFCWAFILAWENGLELVVKARIDPKIGIGCSLSK